MEEDRSLRDLCLGLMTGLALYILYQGYELYHSYLARKALDAKTMQKKVPIPIVKEKKPKSLGPQVAMKKSVTQAVKSVPPVV